MVEKALAESPSLRSPAVWIGTASGFGYAPIVPGTFGSLAGVLFFLALVFWLFPLLEFSLPALLAGYAAILVAVSGLGVWAAGRCEEIFGREDDGRIVIDEVAGQLITLTPVLVLGATAASVPELATGELRWWSMVVTAFVVFRVLDIWKPGAVRRAEEGFEGGLGVMMDDLLAGLLGAVLMTLPCYGLVVAALTRSGGLRELLG
jgi:phosphatidylglycerophosphatase A